MQIDPNTDSGPNPSGLCMCGCGQKTRLAPQTSTEKGWVRGQPLKYVGKHRLRQERIAEICRAYVDDHEHMPSISRRLGVSKATVRRALISNGILPRSRNVAARLVRTGNVVPDEQIADWYGAGLSLPEIHHRFGIPIETARQSLLRLGIERRSKKDASRLRRNTTKRRNQRAALLAGIRECAICQTIDDLECHHIDADPRNEDPANLMWLCWEHHVFVEWLVTKAVRGIRSREVVSST